MKNYYSAVHVGNSAPHARHAAAAAFACTVKASCFNCHIRHQLFKLLKAHRRRNSHVFIMPDIMRQLAVNTGLSAFRCILQHCLAIIFRLINDYVTRNKGNQLSVQAFGEFLQQLLLVRCITAVADDTAQTHTAAHSKALNALGDIVGSIQLISSPEETIYISVA